MIKFNPSRVLHGPDLCALLLESGIASRLGRHALLLTDSGLERDGVVATVRNHLERAGIESILFDVPVDNVKSSVVKDAVTLASGGRVEYVIGLGSQIALDIAKTTCLTAGTGKDVYHLIDSSEIEPLPGVLPFLAVPTRCWNPLLFSGLAVVTDARDGAARLVTIGAGPDTVFFSTELLYKLTGKQIVYDLLCILASTIETMLEAVGGVGYPLVADASKNVVSILRTVPSADTPPDREATQIAGIHSSWFSSHPGVGYALGRAAHSRVGIAPEWITGALLPRVTDFWMKQNPEQISLISTTLGLEPTGNQEDDAYGIEQEIRSLTALADAPLRLRDLGLVSGYFSDIAESASRMCGVEMEKLKNLLYASL